MKGAYESNLKWISDDGNAAFREYDPSSENGAYFETIELGSTEAKVVADIFCRRRGYGVALKGRRDMRLYYVTKETPPDPPDEDYRLALGLPLWNPFFGAFVCETNGAIFVNAWLGFYRKTLSTPEARAGMVPVAWLVDRYRKAFPRGSHWCPVIDVAGWIPRTKIPAFARNEPASLLVVGEDDMPAIEPPREIPKIELQNDLEAALKRESGPPAPNPKDKPKVTLRRPMRRGDDPKPGSPP